MEKEKKGLYRIGDYSRYMGVSTDLLKHYERCGLLRARTGENGYRYYIFPESSKLLDCMRLRNYGFSLSEMKNMLSDLSYDEVQDELERKIEEMKEQIRFQQMVIAEQEKVSAWMERMRDKEQETFVKDGQTMLFLPQSLRDEFIQDKRIVQLLRTWVAAMPMVKSCRYFPDIYQENPLDHAMWGVAISLPDAKALNLPVNDAVIRIAGGGRLYMDIRHTLIHDRNAKNYLPDVLEMLRGYKPRVKGPVLQFSLMNLVCSEESHMNCGWFVAPLDEE